MCVNIPWVCELDRDESTSWGNWRGYRACVVVLYIPGLMTPAVYKHPGTRSYDIGSLLVRERWCSDPPRHMYGMGVYWVVYWRGDLPYCVCLFDCGSWDGFMI